MRNTLACMLFLSALLTPASQSVLAQGSQAVQSPSQPAKPASPADPAADRGPRSESPHLQAPAHLRNLPKIVPPPPSARRSVSDPMETETYEVATGRTSRVPSSAAPTSPEGAPKASPGFQGLLPGVDTGSELRQRKSVIGADGRVQVFNTTDFPWRTVVYLAVSFPSGSGGCTGEMIDAFHIFTAGHCVHDGTSWANSIQAFPGRSGASTPYSFAWGTWFRSYTGWTVDQNHEHDWAVVTLDRNIGNFTGWMGRITMGCSWPYLFGFGCDSRYGGTWNNAGYPDLAPDFSGGAERMYFDADAGQKANDNNHWYFSDTRPGNSGGPVWYFDGTNRYIGTIHAYGDDGSGANHGTRLNSDKYDRTNSWLAADAPFPPVDRADIIDDGQPFIYAFPTTVIRGETSMSVGSDVRNIGTAAAGGFWVQYVLSSNTFISTSDYHVCYAWVGGVSSFTWANSDCVNTISAAVPPGLYYLGAIMDPFGWITEFDESNNTVYKTAYQVTVEAKYALSVATAGSGSGSVSSAPAGISCGVDCSEDYLQNTLVNLTATPAAGSVFTGWSGACAGTGACSVTMNAATSVTATFEVMHLLTVQRLGTGSGTVTSAPGGINCGADCDENFATGTVVLLTATPAPGSAFKNWSGGCSGKVNPCSVTVAAATTVKATFVLNADLQLTKTDSPDPVKVGNVLTYTIQVTNAGPNATSKVKMTDTLPASAVYLSAVPTQGTFVTAVSGSGATKVTWTVGELASGASATIVVRVRPSVAGSLKNSASVTTTETNDPVPGNNKQTATTVINP